MNRTIEVPDEPVMADREILPLLGFKFPSALYRLRQRGMFPKGELRALSRGKVRRVVPTAEVHDAIARLRIEQIPAARLEHFKVGRALATDLRRERRDLGFYARRVVMELGADHLARVIAPFHQGPLRQVRRGQGAAIRVALRSALRHAGRGDS